MMLADFGLSIDATEERPVTRAGTLDYMAPEVCTIAAHSPKLRSLAAISSLDLLSACLLRSVHLQELSISLDTVSQSSPSTGYHKSSTGMCGYSMHALPGRWAAFK